MIGTVLRFLYPTARPFVDYVVRDDGDGPYLAEWHLAQRQPSKEELEAVAESAQFQVWKDRAAAQRIQKQQQIEAIDTDRLTLADRLQTMSEQAATMDANQYRKSLKEIALIVKSLVLASK